MMGRWIAATALATATFASSWTIGMAVADPAPPSLVLHDGNAQVATAIEIDRMYPGLAVTRPYLIGLNATAPESTLTMLLDGLVDLERGCNRPEIRSGDVTCGEEDGEMSQQLLVSAALAPTTTDCDGELGTAASALVPTTLAQLARDGHLELGDAAPGDRRCLLLTFDLPGAADNLVQTDLARFDLTIGAEQVTDTGVAPDDVERPDGAVAGDSEQGGAVVGDSEQGGAPRPAVQSRQVSLPATGSEIVLWGIVAAVVGLSGAGLLRWTRRPRRAR